MKSQCFLLQTDFISKEWDTLWDYSSPISEEFWQCVKVILNKYEMASKNREMPPRREIYSNIMCSNVLKTKQKIETIVSTNIVNKRRWLSYLDIKYNALQNGLAFWALYSRRRSLFVTMRVRRYWQLSYLCIDTRSESPKVNVHIGMYRNTGTVLLLKYHNMLNNILDQIFCSPNQKSEQ